MSLIFSASLRQQKWLSLSPVPRSVLPAPWRPWLLDTGSLTQNLKDLAPGRFSVRVLKTGFHRASLSEAQALGISCDEQIYVREVALCIDGGACIFARSIIPRRTLTGAERQLLWLKNKPLGEFLFQHKHMARKQIEVKQGQVNHQDTWARRSIFTVSGKPLLVSEYFLPKLFLVK